MTSQTTTASGFPSERVFSGSGFSFHEPPAEERAVCIGKTDNTLCRHYTLQAPTGWQMVNPFCSSHFPAEDLSAYNDEVDQLNPDIRCPLCSKEIKGNKGKVVKTSCCIRYFCLQCRQQEETPPSVKCSHCKRSTASARGYEKEQIANFPDSTSLDFLDSWKEQAKEKIISEIESRKSLTADVKALLIAKRSIPLKYQGPRKEINKTLQEIFRKVYGRIEFIPQMPDIRAFQKLI